MNLRRNIRNGVIHLPDCRYAGGPTVYTWTWALNKDEVHVVEAVRNNGLKVCRTCKPLVLP